MELKWGFTGDHYVQIVDQLSHSKVTSFVLIDILPSPSQILTYFLENKKK